MDDEYFFGKDLLVCPLTLEDGTSREVYLPEGMVIISSQEKRSKVDDVLCWKLTGMRCLFLRVTVHWFR
ncbi:MAG: hypothetical protein ACLS3U_06290 [Lachnospiraceae bacterium]